MGNSTEIQLIHFRMFSEFNCGYQCENSYTIFRVLLSSDKFWLAMNDLKMEIVVTSTKAKIRPDGDENHLSCQCSTGCHVRFASHILRSPEIAWVMSTEVHGQGLHQTFKTSGSTC